MDVLPDSKQVMATHKHAHDFFGAGSFTIQNSCPEWWVENKHSA